ncbi:hypothetical protein DJ568_12070 [Mucilaginibacter hurinus]|uniref:Uncharacterized protein n=1 Tax=Mucilaginibacter hurinus TaxID=2201324 RepID=A0A367GPG9_9SPHI|nr:hypothetical protein [Mucilaginibacter hurinus]RCH54551.1 hypothetical protein DJ568_12070 [Mucilaginibacter hurinus]
MRILIISLLLLVGFLNISAQVPKECNFLSDIQFKNGKAIIVVKASLQSIHQAPDHKELKKLSDKNKLSFKDYFTYHECCGWVGSAISFYPSGCLGVYMAYKFNKGKYPNLVTGNTYYLTCAVYKNTAEDPVILLTGISEKAPDRQ